MRPQHRGMANSTGTLTSTRPPPTYYASARHALKRHRETLGNGAMAVVSLGGLLAIAGQLVNTALQGQALGALAFLGTVSNPIVPALTAGVLLIVLVAALWSCGKAYRATQACPLTYSPSEREQQDDWGGDQSESTFYDPNCYSQGGGSYCSSVDTEYDAASDPPSKGPST